MPNTPKGLTYPSSSSPVAVPADIQELATDVDGLIVPNTGGTYTGSVSFTQPPSVPTPTSGLHAVNKTYADAINTDVTALETELGTNPSGTFSTVVQRLDSYTDGFNKVGNLLTANQASGTDTLGDTTGFGMWGGATYERTTATAASGTGCLKVNYTSAGSGDACTIRASVGDMIAVKAGETITVHVKAKQGSGTRSRAQLWGGFFDESNIIVAYAAQQRLTVTSSFQSIYNTLVVPAGATRFAVVFGTPDTGADTDYMYFDEFGFWKGSGGQWAMPGTPIPGQGAIKANGAVELPGGDYSPEGVVTANPGSTWLQTSGAATVTGMLTWRKATGTGNTGWVPEGALADTGWRNVTCELAYWDNVSVFRVRRVGQRATVLVRAETTAGGSGWTGVLYTLPTGFGGIDYTVKGAGFVVSSGTWYPVPIHNTGGSNLVQLGTSNDTPASLGAGALLWFEVSFAGPDAWPSSLPGSAA